MVLELSDFKVWVGVIWKFLQDMPEVAGKSHTSDVFKSQVQNLELSRIVWYFL